MARRTTWVVAAVAVGDAAEWAGYGWADVGHWLPDLFTGWFVIACGLIRLDQGASLRPGNSGRRPAASMR